MTANNTPANASNTALAVFQPENVRTLAELGPKSYNENSVSHLRCLEAGHELLSRVKNEGMSDALDKDIAHFIEKAKLTVKKMNSKRTPVTQLFDRIRKAYTSLENEIDPTKEGSTPALLQTVRNDYARKKHEAEERRLREEAARQARQNLKARYRSDVETDFCAQFNELIALHIDRLNKIDASLTPDNFNAVRDTLRNYPCELPAEWLQTVASRARRFIELTEDDNRAIQANVLAGLAERFREQFPFEVQSTRDELLDRLPSKKRELERIAKANAEEAERLKKEMEEKERAEAARKEAERRDREQKEAEAARLAAQKQEMDGLFGLPVAQADSYQPKTQVKKRAVIETPEDIMAVVGFWWSQEGSTKSVDELKKEFKKQINYANAAANSKTNPTFISSLRYEDDVKAK